MRQHRTVCACLLAGFVLGGCGSHYAVKQDIKSAYGKPELVQYISGEQYAFTLYGKRKPSAIGPADQENWFYINRQLVVFYYNDGRYETRRMSVLELLNCQGIYNELYRRDNPIPEAKPGDDKPQLNTINPATVRRPPDYVAP